VIAEKLANILLYRVASGCEVFVSTGMAPGADPDKTMLDDNLVPSVELVIVMDEAATRSHWVTWEVASGWALRKLLIPVFVGVSASSVLSPLPKLVQGGRLDDRVWLDRAIASVVERVGRGSATPLTDDEFERLSLAYKRG
jgi:hypothetical protein